MRTLLNWAAAIAAAAAYIVQTDSTAKNLVPVVARKGAERKGAAQRACAPSPEIYR